MLSWSGAGARRPPPADSTRPSGIRSETEWYIRGRAGDASCLHVLVAGLHCSAVRVPLALKSLTSVEPPITIASPVGSIVTLWNERAVDMSGTALHTGDPLVMSRIRAFFTDGTGLLGSYASRFAAPPVTRNLPGAKEVHAPKGTCVVPRLDHALVRG